MLSVHDALKDEIWINFSAELARVVIMTNLILHALSPRQVLLLDEAAVIDHLKLSFISSSSYLSLLELRHTGLLLKLG